MANECIGHVTCQWCGSKKASVSVSKAQLCVVTCRACQAQTFARGNYSDSMIRQAMRPVERPATVPAMPEPAPGMAIEPKPAQPSTPAASEGTGIGKKAATKPEPKEEQKSEQAPKKRGAWDLW